MDVDRILAGERRGIGIGIIDRAAHRDAGIVDEDVEPAEMFGDVVHQLFDFGGRRLVGLVGAGLHALGLQFGTTASALSGEAT